MASPLRLRGVAFAFPGQPPLFEGLDLEIQPGTTTALVGRSGSGKSTVLRLVAGLLPPSAGQIDAPAGRMAFVFQSPTLLAWRTLADNVRLPLELG
jgi:NitT/TauT family transport system ATP-binding protein